MSLWGAGLALLFGALWLALLMPRKLNSIWLWLVFLSGAALFIVSILWVQTPLQTLVSNLLTRWLGAENALKYYYVTGIPGTLISGFVQEAAKFVPIVLYWRIYQRSEEPLTLFSVGAMCGAGFGVFEAQWIINLIFSYGFKWDLVLLYGFEAVTGIWERLVTVAFHTSTGAVMGWGLAKNKAWQFFLFTAVWHSLLNYVAVWFRAQKLSVIEVEIIISILIIVPFGLAFFIRREPPLRTENE